MSLHHIARMLLATTAVALCVPASGHALAIGIADQKADMFSDPLFLTEHFPVARRQVPWNVMQDEKQRAQLDAWMAGARAAHVRPLITFGPGTGEARRVLPTPSALARQLHLIRAEYPWAREFGSWNEANHCGSGMCRRPGLVARYYVALRRSCRACVVLAAEVLDVRNMRAWIARFTAALPVRYRHGIHWGLHNYVDANRLQTRGTIALLRATTGPVWLTETGGIVRRRNPHKVSFEESTAHAARATRWLFDRIVPLSSRIRRVYLYHWNARPRSTWDSALISSDGAPRPAFRVLTAVLHRQALSAPHAGSRRARTRAARSR